MGLDEQEAESRRCEASCSGSSSPERLLSGELLQAHTARVCMKELLQNGTTLRRCTVVADRSASGHCNCSRRSGSSDGRGSQGKRQSTRCRSIMLVCSSGDHPAEMCRSNKLC